MLSISLATVLRARDEGLPLPGAVSAATPWSDLDKIGDSYFANEYVDNMLVTWDGWLAGAALIFANWPYSLLVVLPVNKRIAATPPDAADARTRGLIETWGRLHAGRGALGVAATLVYLWASA